MGSAKHLHVLHDTRGSSEGNGEDQNPYLLAFPKTTTVGNPIGLHQCVFGPRTSFQAELGCEDAWTHRQ